jgi:HrpA-like RNA helicase
MEKALVSSLGELRAPAMEEARRQLPIIGLEQEVMEGINRHDVVVSGADC